MSIWMLLTFAASCLLAVFAFGDHNIAGTLSLQLFAATMLAFTVGLFTRGIRPPVI
ncbi:MAG: hypothetical protein ACYC6N_19630 [Pirellulaceae bacterium]